MSVLVFHFWLDFSCLGNHTVANATTEKFSEKWYPQQQNQSILLFAWEWGGMLNKTDNFPSNVGNIIFVSLSCLKAPIIVKVLLN